MESGLCLGKGRGWSLGGFGQRALFDFVRNLPLNLGSWKFRAKSGRGFPALLAWFGSAPMFSNVAIALLACSVCAASIKAVIPGICQIGIGSGGKSISVKLVRQGIHCGHKGCSFWALI